MRTRPAGAAHETSRRDFLKTAGRAIIGGALGLLGALLVGKLATGKTGGGKSCVNDSYCRTCGVKSDCSLPQALSFRQRFGG